jgi:uncharacterized protein
MLGWGSKKTSGQHDDEDMSMEEILASIRKYVSEEPAPKEPQGHAAESPLAESPYRVDPPVTSQTVSQSSQSRGLESEIPVLAPKNSFEQSALFTSSTASAEAAGLGTGAAPADDYAVTRKTIQVTAPNSEPDLGQEVSLSRPAPQQNPFAKLAEVAKKEGESALNRPVEESNITLNQLIRDLAKPMIQRWIDQNLSKIVEQMVADEISKMTGN